MYKIGTRGSLLAVTQCTLIKQQLEALIGERFELHLIKTQGDQITDRPLWQLEGKDFFTKELDEALLAGTVDLVVHSYKDLGSERPEGLALAAVTERHFAHDVLLVPRAHLAKLADWQGEFVVGTSSPRRVVNLTRDLPDFLPGRPRVRCETLRGNVNTRIQKLKDGKYHAITLALAGLDRLAQLDASRTELEALLQGLTFMVLPLSAFPAAAAQGALAIETRADRRELRDLIGRLHHFPTAAAVSREREAFKGYGGGCHLAVGIHVRAFDGDFLHFHRGEKDGVDIQVRRREGALPPEEKPGQVFLGQGRAVGQLGDTLYHKRPTNRIAPSRGRQVFITTSHALPSYGGDATALWAAGTETHRKLAQAGHWVNGNADSLGHGELQRLDQSRALRIMSGGAPWLVLSHARAESPLGEVFAAYEQEMSAVPEGQRQALASVTHAWWASFPQYEAYVRAVPEMARARHYCGLGKTWAAFGAHGISATGLTDHHEFLQLMGKA